MSPVLICQVRVGSEILHFQQFSPSCPSCQSKDHTLSSQMLEQSFSALALLTFFVVVSCLACRKTLVALVATTQ